MKERYQVKVQTKYLLEMMDGVSEEVVEVELQGN